MTFLFLLVLLLPYLAVGAKYSRTRYAAIMASANQKTQDVAAIKTAKKKVESFNSDIREARSTNITALIKHHKPGCDKVRYSHIGSCDCGFLSRHQAELEKHQNFLEGKVDEPDVIKPMLLWPGYGIVDYLKSGTVSPNKTYNPDYTRALEQELEILR